MAIARALATEPELVLLDEPLTGLDAESTPAIRALLSQVLGRDGQSALIVTHDIMDAVAVADRVLVLDSGRVAELGDTATVLARPTSQFGARFAGVNLVDGIVGADGALHNDDPPSMVCGPVRENGYRGGSTPSRCSHRAMSRCICRHREAVHAMLSPYRSPP